MFSDEEEIDHGEHECDFYSMCCGKRLTNDYLICPQCKDHAVWKCECGREIA